MPRQARTVLEKIRTLAWFNAVQKQAQLPSAYAMQNQLLESTAIEMANFYRYQSGEQSPGATTLKATEKLWPNTARVFTDGPDGVPLWRAFGAVEEARAALDALEPLYGRSTYFGYSLRHCVVHLVRTMVKDEEVVVPESPMLADLSNEGVAAPQLPVGALPAKLLQPVDTGVVLMHKPVDRARQPDTRLAHPIVRAHAEGRLLLGSREVAAALCLWRLAHFTGVAWYEADWLLAGLTTPSGMRIQRNQVGEFIGRLPSSKTQSALEEYFAPYAISALVLEELIRLWQANLERYEAVVHRHDTKLPNAAQRFFSKS